MAEAVGHEGDKAARLAQDVQDSFSILQDAALILSANVIDLPVCLLWRGVQNGIQRGAVIADVNPVAGVLPIAIDRQRAVIEGIEDKERKLLFRILIRAVVLLHRVITMGRPYVAQ